MKIVLENLGKRYNSEWIFRGINYEFDSGVAYAILGANGSGKSTLLQVIGGNISSSEGGIRYLQSDGIFDEEKIFKQLSFASPYLELPEEMTLLEIVKFHFSFKKLFPGFSQKQIIESLELKKAERRQLKYFSSGMKQRVRLGLAILSDTSLLLLDEPLSNLDKIASDWYSNLIHQFSKDRIIIVCSNHQEKEYDFCIEKIQLENFKVQVR